MNFWIMLGFALGAGEIVTDRFIHKLPNWLAIALLVIALVLMFTGFFLNRRELCFFR